MDKQHHKIEISTYIIVWLSLLAFTSITVTIAGISLGKYTLFIALLIAAIKSALVINIFMHIKFDEPIFKAFLALSSATLIIIFVLTFFDIIYR
ncbi:MAG: cytochrome C oxidase subunit IV family protein [Melioribacter sp.]|uniref:cytochrome C oxidase subunit IV family protein n=1 Tax=Rosettibacter primus TaxID=3111523 RepID=UPI00247E8B61|nr:cytochrome C oxidase subunit IV family protein [Melioribacter sp.]